MSRCLIPLCVVAVLMFAEKSVSAQRPLPRLKTSDSENLPRKANDQIEGSIYQFSATLPNSKDERLAGRFRIEETGIFSVEKEVDPPNLRNTVRQLRTGEGSVSVQTGAREKRIGDVVAMENGKFKLEFMSFETLPGFAIIWPKADHQGVYMGYFQELQDGAASQRWKIEVRKSED